MAVIKSGASTDQLTVDATSKAARVTKYGTDGVALGATATSGMEKVGIADSLGGSVSAFPATFLRVSDEPRQLFYDAFDSTLDVTNRWTSTQGSSGVAAANTAGTMSMGTGVVANGYSKLVSQPSFTLPIPGWLGVSDAITLPDGAAPTANSYRYWGTGTTPGTPTVATPVTDGYGFELNTDGKLRAVVYAGGTRTVIADLSAGTGTGKQPLDALPHRYIIYIRTDRTYWYIDGITGSQLVATSNFQSSQVQALPRLFLAIGNSTPPASNTQIQSHGATAWDTGKNATQIADGVMPWRKATVNAAGALSVATASPLAANVLVGTLSHTATTAAATIITVPAGRTWQGTIGISCAASSAAASATTGQALGLVATAGTNVTPAAATVLACEAKAGANAATGTVGSSGANSITVPMTVVAPAGNAVTLTGASTCAGNLPRVDYVASGTLVAT